MLPCSNKSTGPFHPKAFVGFVALLLLGITIPVTAKPKDTENILEVYALAKPILDNPTTDKPFYLHAEVVKRRQMGEAALYFEQPFKEISSSLSKLGNWCEVLLLHLNTKACTHSRRKRDKTLTIYLGRKFYQDPDDAFVMTYNFETEKKKDYFSALITAEDGPLGTSDYRIHFEVALINGRTFGRIQVSQKHSWLSSKAAKLYVATKGRKKQGISIVDYDEKGKPIYSSGEQAIAERNLLRYYFAITAYVYSQNGTRSDRFKDSLDYWYDQTEQYEQLYEVDRSQYMKDKYKEYKNQLGLQRLADHEELIAIKKR
ncbi:MAG: hypothetical protein QNI91_17565 [Arenicellales bacterium]|nr:hypothetical protein [Arenicellales bacterium]